MKKVAPVYFNKHSNISSLYRQLNLWGFERVGKTRQKSSAWKHKCFLRAKPESIKFIKRCAVKNGTGKFSKPAESRRPQVDNADATANGSNEKEGNVSTTIPQESRDGSRSCVVAVPDAASNSAFNSSSLSTRNQVDPLLENVVSTKIPQESRDRSGSCVVPVPDAASSSAVYSSPLKTRNQVDPLLENVVSTTIPQESRDGSGNCVVPVPDSASSRALNSSSLRMIYQVDPLLDERLGYGFHLGQDFEGYMSNSDYRSDSWKFNSTSIDTDIDFASVFLV